MEVLTYIGIYTALGEVCGLKTELIAAINEKSCLRYCNLCSKYVVCLLTLPHASIMYMDFSWCFRLRKCNGHPSQSFTAGCIFRVYMKLAKM